MRFTWDPRKSERNLALRGFDFTFAATIFVAPTLERTDTRRDYGEVRRIAIGRTHGVCLTVVYTDRLDAGRQIIRRIISARRSKRREYRDYAKAYPKS